MRARKTDLLGTGMWEWIRPDGANSGSTSDEWRNSETPPETLLKQMLAEQPEHHYGIHRLIYSKWMKVGRSIDRVRTADHVLTINPPPAPPPPPPRFDRDAAIDLLAERYQEDLEESGLEAVAEGTFAVWGETEWVKRIEGQLFVSVEFSEYDAIDDLVNYHVHYIWQHMTTAQLQQALAERLDCHQVIEEGAE